MLLAGEDIDPAAYLGYDARSAIEIEALSYSNDRHLPGKEASRTGQGAAEGDRVLRSSSADCGHNSRSSR